MTSRLQMSSNRLSVSAEAVCVLIEALEEIGGDSARTLARSGITATITDLREGRIRQIPQSTFIRLCEECVLEFEHYGCLRDQRPRFPVERLKMMCLVMLACPTLEIALKSAIDFHIIAMDGQQHMELRVEGETARFILRHPAGKRWVGDLLVILYGLSTFHRLAGWLIGEELQLSALTLVFPAKVQVPAFNELLPVRPECEANWNSIAFPAAHLQRPGIRTYADLQGLFRLFPFALTPPDYGTAQFSDHVRSLYRTFLARNDALPTAADMSSIFSVSASTLRRRLAQENVSLTQIRQSCRRTLAMELLAGSRLSVKEISARLQFHDVATFRRAFRNWTGLPPSAYRRQKRHPADNHAEFGPTGSRPLVRKNGRPR